MVGCACPIQRVANKVQLQTLKYKPMAQKPFLPAFVVPISSVGWTIQPRTEISSIRVCSFMPRPLVARIAGWPHVVHARADTGTTEEEADAAATARASYAVASGNNLDLTATPPRRLALLVEPSPFTHTSGYSSRFKNLLMQLQEAGDEVLVIVPDNSPDAPTEFAGAKIVNVPGFRFPLYRRITLTLGLRGVYQALKDFDPDVIHLTTPGFLIFSTLLYARLLRKALLLSYHTHVSLSRFRFSLIPYACAEFSLKTL